MAKAVFDNMKAAGPKNYFNVGITDDQLRKGRGATGIGGIRLSAEEFIRRYLQHVLPSGFMKVRRYGFANPNCSVSLKTVKALVELSLGFEEGRFEPESVAVESVPRCPDCGGKLKYPHSVLPFMTGAGKDDG